MRTERGMGVDEGGRRLTVASAASAASPLHAGLGAAGAKGGYGPLRKRFHDSLMPAACSRVRCRAEWERSVSSYGVS